MRWKCFLISNATPCADDDVVVGVDGIDGFAGTASVCFAAVCQTGFRVVGGSCKTCTLWEVLFLQRRVMTASRTLRCAFYERLHAFLNEAYAWNGTSFLDALFVSLFFSTPLFLSFY